MGGEEGERALGERRFRDIAGSAPAVKYIKMTEQKRHRSREGRPGEDYVYDCEGGDRLVMF